MNRGVRKELALLVGVASLGLWLGRRKPLAAAIGLGAAVWHFWPSFSYSLRNRSVVITGGSRGLGLALAEEFLREGARVALLARDSEELDRAQELLQQKVAGQIFCINCDVTEPAELARAIDQIEGFFGHIDVLVNNAGAIAIGPFETMEKANFVALLELQVHAVVSATNAVLPIFRANGSGRIVNICSIAGKVAVPHMSTYCAAKFALAGLSTAMNAELASENITVTTVFPGLMRTGSPVQAVIKGDPEKEYAWFALGDSAPLISISAGEAARRIVTGVRAGDAQVVFPTTAKLAIFAHNNFPELTALIMRIAARFFPKGLSRERRTGADSQEWLEKQAWADLIRPAMESERIEGNEAEKSDPRFNLGL